MELTKKQEEGLKIALERYRAGERYTVIAGYAGTGKSTLISAIIDALDVDPAVEVVYATFTGKASLVLREKGCQNAMTLHKLLYEARMNPDGTFTFMEKNIIDTAYKVVVVDEISMVSGKLWNQLLKASNCYILALGDPFQLPAINGKEGGGEDLLKNPHIFLDEIMRQAKESEIIRVTMDIRSGKKLANYRGNDVIICDLGEAVTGMYTWADQCICATNKTREVLNQLIRNVKGFPSDRIVDGDKIICNHNYWEYFSGDPRKLADDPKDDLFPLVNGTIGYVSHVSEEIREIPRYDRIYKRVWSCPKEIKGTVAKYFETPNCEFFNLFMDTQKILLGKDTLSPELIYRMNGEKYDKYKPKDCSFGWVISCHRSQGSQWNKVTVREENFPFSKEEHARWLYTAATRAIDKLVIIRKD